MTLAMIGGAGQDLRQGVATMVFERAGQLLEQLGTILGGRQVVPPVPEGRVVVLPVADREEPAEAADDRGEPPALALFISYVDAAGAASQRRITVRQLIGTPPETVLAFCHERRAPRHFRIDRISEAIDPVTGEVLAGDAIVAALSGAGFEAVDPAMRRAVNVLVFLMRCDGHEHPAEWEAVDQALASFILRFGGDDADHERLMRMARQVAPNAEDFLIGLRSFASSNAAPQLAQWLQRSVAAVVDADGRHTEEEFAWLSRVREFLLQMEAAR